jgi:N-acetylmuramoyl-L-alanine amidase
VTVSVPWTADSTLAGAVRPSPNHDERRGRITPDSLVLHYTGMADGLSALAWLCDTASQVSCHYLVGEDGTVVQLVSEARRAWHAGQSVWAGKADMNSASVGIEIVNGGHAFGLPAFPDPQIAAVIALCRDIAARHAIAPERVLAHSDIAPRRKQDPGERFPWRALAEEGICLWVPPCDEAAAVLACGTSSDEVEILRADLARYGYGLDVGPLYDDATAVVVSAFQRRFRPWRVDGAADAGTLDTLARLLDLRFAPLNADRAPARSPV